MNILIMKKKMENLLAAHNKNLLNIISDVINDNANVFKQYCSTRFYSSNEHTGHSSYPLVV